MAVKDLRDLIATVASTNIDYNTVELDSSGNGISITDDDVLPELYYGAQKGLVSTSYTVQVYSKDKREFQTLRTRIKTLLHGYNGTQGSTYFNEIRVLSDIVTTEEREGGIINRSIMTINSLSR